MNTGTGRRHNVTSGKLTEIGAWELRDNVTGALLSDHPNAEGARLAALFHVNNGDKITWEGGPITFHGVVNGVRRFAVAQAS